MAGTIAQTTGNGIATAGIAYNAKIMPLRVLDDQGSGDSAAIARAIRWAARYGADVINLSLEFPAEVRAAEIPDVIGALRYARRHGALVVGAAGNQADFMVAYPARATSVMAVGATTITGCQADYSNSGRDLDVVAPGGGADAPNSDSIWDSQHCNPDSFGRPIFQQTFVARGVRHFGLPRWVRGDVDGRAARVRDRRAHHRDEAARAASPAARGRGAHRGDGAADRPPRSLRRRARRRGRGAQVGLRGFARRPVARENSSSGSSTGLRRNARRFCV